jgi:type II secretory ATPase GspE/PulE/Tfp pilus assembly ATPase PilB-like protein
VVYLLAQKQSDQTIVKLVERLKSQGYEVRPNAALRGKSGGDHTFDYLVLRRDGFMSLLAAIEVINDAEDPETSLHKLFAFQDKCSECGINRSVVIAIPRLSFVASQFAQKDGVEVFDEQAVQMFLTRPPASRAALKDVPSAFFQKTEVLQALKTLGYRVDESVKVVGDSGTEHVFGAIALWDDGFMLSRLGIDYLSSDSVDRAQLSLFDEKCRDAGVTERMLLVPKGLTDEAKKFAEQKRIEIVSLDGRRKEAVPEGATSLPSASTKGVAEQSRQGSADAEKSPKAAIPAAESASPMASAEKTGEQKKTDAVSAVEPSKPSTLGREASPVPGAAQVSAAQEKMETPASIESGANPVVSAMESPSRARAFSMRSVIDQFLGPQVRPKQVEKNAVAVGSKAAAPEGSVGVSGEEVSRSGAMLGRPAVAQVKGLEVKTVEAKSMEAKTALVAEKPAGSQVKAADGKAPEVKPAGAVPMPSADKLGVMGVKGPEVKAVEARTASATEKSVGSQTKAGEPAVAGIKTPEAKPGPSAGGPGIAAQVKPAEAKAVLVAERPNVAQVKNLGSKLAEPGPMEGKSISKAVETPKAPMPVAERTAQAKVLSPAMKVEVALKPPAGGWIQKQGVIDKSSAGVQPPKPMAEKPGVEKRPVPVAQAKVPAKPPEPPKPVVEEVVEKPKVKLRKAARPEALQLIPESTARRFTVLPIGVTDNVLEVAMVNAADLTTIQILEHQSKMRIKPVAAEKKEILDAIDFNYKGFGQIAEQISHIETGADANAGADLVASTANAPVSAALNLIVEEAVKARASDIHIEPEEKRLRIRYRIDGVLHEVMSLPIKIHPPLTSRVKVMSDLNIADHLRPQDGQFSIEVKGKSIDVRVATSPTVHGETVVMRILDKSLAAMSLPQLGFSEDSLAKYEKMLAVPFGMICVSGPTGSGKTTTLYASLNTMDKVTRNIITVEDPVEYRFEGIKQIQVNPKAGLTFANVLRSMMRLDPDVILVGEVRDAETASIAVKSALTGHTVLCSIHANDAVSVVYRLLDLGVEPFMVASVVTGTIAQRMARRICSNCATEVKPTLAEAAAYESATGEKLESFMSGSGCELCSFSGFKGRLGLYEVLGMTDTTRSLILKGATTSELRDQAIKDGMITLFKDGMLKVKAGQTTVSEVLRNAYSID